jgi:hypothetical protein
MPINRRSRLYGRFHCGLPTQCARAARTEGHGAPQFWQRAGFRGRPGPAPCVLRSAAMRRASRFVSLCIHTEDSRFALVRVHACGVCRTDLHVVEGELAPRKSPVVPGTRWRAWWKRTDSTRRGSILASAGGAEEHEQRRRSACTCTGVGRARRPPGRSRAGPQRWEPERCAGSAPVPLFEAASACPATARRDRPVARTSGPSRRRARTRTPAQR